MTSGQKDMMVNVSVAVAVVLAIKMYTDKWGKTHPSRIQKGDDKE